MPRVRDDGLGFRDRLAQRPFIAKVSAAVLIAGVVSLMSSPEAFDRAKAGATSPMKPSASRIGSATAAQTDCSSDRLPASEALP